MACAAQAAAALPRSADAHSERAAALAALDRLDEARVAYARALAIDPDHADALLGAADLYVSRLPPSREFTELAFEYARRGRLGARKAKNRTLVGQFALLEASALNGLGRNKEALERADEAIQLDPDEAFDARKERTLALWELCRFEEARKAIDGLLAEADDRHRAWAYYHLGLLLERHGRDAESAAAFAKARQLDPEGFPTEPDVPAAEFATLVRAAVDGLPADMQRDLDGIPVTADEIPNTEDLTASDPPLSPTILGLFRGPSKGEDCPPPDDDPGPCRSVAVYRRNLLRVVADRGELARQIRATLIHEIGHLRGEDDVQLAARGLE